MMDRDPFDEVLPPPALRTNDHETSRLAAEAVTKVQGGIAREVMKYADWRAGFGFTDDDLKVAFPNAPESSYRKRRTELAAKGYLHAAGDQRHNRNHRLELVWRITEKGRAAL